MNDHHTLTHTMSSSSTSASPLPRSKKLVVPKVWKRPHSTIYGKNVEYGSSLYSDKIGELNGRKFNSELPWTMRNSGSVASSSLGSAGYNQGYLSILNSQLVDPNSPRTACLHDGDVNKPTKLNDSLVAGNFADLLDLTNPSRFSKKRQPNRQRGGAGASGGGRIDFYEQYQANFYDELNHMNNSSLLMTEPLLTRRLFDNFLDYDSELGLFLPVKNNDTSSADYRSLIRTNDHRNYNLRDSSMDINTKSFVPSFAPSTTAHNDYDKLLPKHQCQLTSSPYGQTADGRKLSLGSINPQSYRPSLPHKTTTAHSSDGEEFEFQDKSSPFYTDRWVTSAIMHL